MNLLLRFKIVRFAAGTGIEIQGTIQRSQKLRGTTGSSTTLAREYCGTTYCKNGTYESFDFDMDLGPSLLCFKILIIGHLFQVFVHQRAYPNTKTATKSCR